MVIPIPEDLVILTIATEIPSLEMGEVSETAMLITVVSEIQEIQEIPEDSEILIITQVSDNREI